MRALVAVLLLVNFCLVLGDCPAGICSSDETCCPGPQTGMYGCCPSPNAVCCSDGLHCCPTDTVCDLAKGTCDDQKNPLIPHIFRKTTSPPKQKSEQVLAAKKFDVIYCPGGQYYCPDGNTCCLLSTGQYGCCPYPLATCCADKIHCCPNGTRCDSTSQYCLQGKKRFPALPKGFAHPML